MKKFTLITVFLLTAKLLSGQIIHVPADYASIQQAINAAVNGDTIIVSDGIYFEQINFLGKKNLLVTSEYISEGDTSHITNTIIDGSAIMNYDSASVVYFISGEDSTSILCGFTIQNGKGTVNNTWNDREGGAVWISGSGACIRNNRITHNSCEDYSPSNSMGVGGGGIGIDSVQPYNWVVLKYNMIDSNAVLTNRPNCFCDGAGVLCGTNIIMVGNKLLHNLSQRTVSGQSYYSSAGGVYCYGDIKNGNQVVIMSNSFIENKVYGNLSWGGGVIFDQVQLNFSGNIVAGNVVGSLTNVTNIGGGGMVAQNCLPGSVIAGNLFRGNYSQSWSGGLNIASGLEINEPIRVENNYFIENHAGGWGGALGVVSCPVKIVNNVFSRNLANYAGVGYIDRPDPGPESHYTYLINNTFAYNKAIINIGGLEFAHTNPLILNSLFWKNYSPTVKEIKINNGRAEIAYTNLDSNSTMGQVDFGPGIQNKDPMFSDTLTLIPGHMSECLEAGIQNYICAHNESIASPTYDIQGIARPVDFEIDLGAYEINSWIVGNVNLPVFNSPSVLMNIYPNPFINQFEIELLVSRLEYISIKVYDGQGKMVKLIAEKLMSGGKHQMECDMHILASGEYLVVLQSEQRFISKKIQKNP